MKLYKQEKNYETILFEDKDEEVFNDIELGDYIKYGKSLYFRVIAKVVEDGTRYVMVRHPVTVYDYE